MDEKPNSGAGAGFDREAEVQPLLAILLHILSVVCDPDVWKKTCTEADCADNTECSEGHTYFGVLNVDPEYLPEHNIMSWFCKDCTHYDVMDVIEKLIEDIECDVDDDTPQPEHIIEEFLQSFGVIVYDFYFNKYCDVCEHFLCPSCEKAFNLEGEEVDSGFVEKKIYPCMCPECDASATYGDDLCWKCGHEFDY